jgi:hypothetical protein
LRRWMKPLTSTALSPQTSSPPGPQNYFKP